MKDSFPSLGVLNSGWLSDALVMAASRIGIDTEIYQGELQDSASVEYFVNNVDLITYMQNQVPASLVRNLLSKGNVIRPDPDTQNFGEIEDADFQILVARSPHEQASTWSPVEVIRYGNGVMFATAQSDSEIVQRTALEYAQSVDLIGVALLGLKVNGPQISVTSMEVGPTLWGCWTSTGARTDQFEQHVRALFDLPLGDTRLISSNVVTGYFQGMPGANLYRPYLHLMARNPDLKFEQYGSEVEGFRGHVTAHGENLLDLRSCIEHALDFMNGVIDE
jgi:phosphoribosylaminoimidazole carboxylase (NCAIR synthetase)